MAVVAGIDEAGLGPVLGPLVVSAVAFRAADRAAGESMWDLLRGTVTRRPPRKRFAIAIDDSKKLYSSRTAGGLERLERGVLAMLAARSGAPPTVKKMLAILCPQSADALSQYPWYADADLPLPRTFASTDLDLAANALRVAFRKAGIRLETMRAETVFTGEFNRLISATRNKATAALGVTGRLLMHLWESYPDDPLRILIDRQGGRTRYLPALQRMFAGCRFKVIDEGEALSAYHISDGPRRAELHFLVRGEQQHLPVALASMMSKYLRELFMEMFNGFWARHVTDLKPTAGYYTDGNRFYRDIVPAARRLGVDEQMLYRCR